MINILTSQWAFFIILTLAIFVKEVLFQNLVYRDSYGSILHFPLRFYGAAIAIALSLSAISLLFRHQWWTIALLLVIDIWFMSQIVYYRSWGIWINVQSIQMIDNMSGFWSSILTLLNWKTFVFLATTIAFLPFVFLYEHFLPNIEQSCLGCKIMLFWAILTIAYSYVPLLQYQTWIKYEKEHAKVKNPYSDPVRYNLYNLKPLFRPYNDILNYARNSFRDGCMIIWEDAYVKQHGMIDYAIAMFVFHCSYESWRKSADENRPLPFSDKDINTISLLTQQNFAFKPQRNMIFLLVESFESWVIDYQYKGEYAMPNLRKFMAENRTMYADKISSQVKGGGSGDGQMILQTGMLPLRSGAACRTYGDNVYPNIAHSFPNSITLNPCPGAWNQQIVNGSYGIKELYESFNSADDESVFSELIQRINNTPSPYYIQAITISTHNPFDKAKEVNWNLDNKMPSNIAKYIKCIRYLDLQLGKLFDELENKHLLENTDIVISGDHIIFQSMILHEFLEYAHANGIKLPNNQNYCPLIIYSPTFGSDVRYDKVAYQMDVFPTVMHVVSDTNYWWKGFGIDLFEDRTRVLSEEEASILSDKMIRDNYFAKHNYE